MKAHVSGQVKAGHIATYSPFGPNHPRTAQDFPIFPRSAQSIGWIPIAYPEAVDQFNVRIRFRRIS